MPVYAVQLLLLCTRSPSTNQHYPDSAFGHRAGSVTVVSFIPKVVRVWRTRRISDLSFGVSALMATGAALWLTYGFMTGDRAVIGTNLIVGLLVTAILVAEVRFD
ncbi:hypothetical protein BH23GEM6_BH23GEM6_08350 [soil metagenome]